MQLLKTIGYATLLLFSNVALDSFQSSPRVAEASQFRNQLNLRKHHNGFRSPPLLSRSRQKTNRFRSDKVKEHDPSIGNANNHSLDLKSVIHVQCVLVGMAAYLAMLLNIPNFGFGPNFDLSLLSLQQGFLMTLPLVGWDLFLDLLGDRFPALKDVDKASAKLVLTLFGGTFKPLLGFMISLALGFAVGIGEEIFFRGIIQYGLAAKVGTAASLVVASVLFGAGHGYTPLYKYLAGIGGMYLGYLYLSFGNLAVPIFAHAFYNVGAFYYNHWAVSRLSDKEKSELASLQFPL